mgnify:CR=1 FL=1
MFNHFVNEFFHHDICLKNKKAFKCFYFQENASKWNTGLIPVLSKQCGTCRRWNFSFFIGNIVCISMCERFLNTWDSSFLQQLCPSSFLLCWSMLECLPLRHTQHWHSCSLRCSNHSKWWWVAEIKDQMSSLHVLLVGDRDESLLGSFNWHETNTEFVSMFVMMRVCDKRVKRVLKGC